MALESGRAVFSARQLSNLTGRPEAFCLVYASRLVKAKLAVRLQKGKISFTTDEFIIASQLVEPSYVSLNSALLFHGLSKQVPRNVECVTPVNSLRLDGLGLEYHKISPALYYGFKKLPKGSSYVMIASAEKALLDGIYLNYFTADDAADLTGEMNPGALRDMLGKFEGRGAKKMRRVIERAGKRRAK